MMTDTHENVVRQIENPHHPLLAWAAKHGIGGVSDLAAHLGISQPRLSQIIGRKHRPSPALALTIMRETGIGYEALVELTPAEVKHGVKAGWKKKHSKKVAR